MNLRRILLGLSIIILLIKPASAGDLANLYFSDREISNTSNGRLIIKSDSFEYHISYELYHEVARHSDQYLLEMIKKNFLYLIRFSYENNINISNDCRSDDTLEVYEMNYRTLNSVLFSGDSSSVNRLGLFTILPESERRVAMIVTSNNSIIINETIIAHEIAHYFWDRFCIWRTSTIPSESFARSYDDYYSARN